ncbi:phosphotransferase [Galbitalea soli]|uniref:Maltokinase n=1 Tax=Galbitalea soli TaxID=1268042 RepID=A0A7C9PLN6_9MICO|nr:phosphotransferase [Galbitalea soli]
MRLPHELGEWVAQQRWYGGKGSEPVLERIGGWQAGDDEVVISTHYLLDHSDGGSTLYQVPLTERAHPLGTLAPIAVVEGRYLYDAPHDPAYAATILDLILHERPAGHARGHRQPGAGHVTVASSAVLTGEQSNTSIICRVDDGAPVIMKVFRALHHGGNPDVVLQSAIAATGSTLVPRSIGYVSGEWPAPSLPGGLARGHLLFAQEFLPGAEDAWRIALRAAHRLIDFSAEAHALGRATAEVHATLATALPTREAQRADIDSILESMRARLNGACHEVPALRELHDEIDTVFEAAREAEWPRLQRIHGDYHLGQVLSIPGDSFVLVDFEGEPLRPMAERSEPDVTLRDVAGMLRSFDYAAGSVLLETAGAVTAHDWASAARHAFVDGYIEASGRDIRQNRALLDAFEIDKALYEVVYEARNRPSWIDIPTAAIRRLAERSGR